MSHELEKFIDNNRDAFDDQLPSPRVLAGIEARIANMQASVQEQPQEQKKGIVISFRALRWAAAACLIVLTGTLAFWMGREYDKPTETTLAANTNTEQAQPQATRPTVDEAKIEEPIKEQGINYAANNQQSAHEQRKQVLFARLGNMTSASARMQAAMQAYSLNNPDKEIVDALVTSMNSDPSTNVRLAALEALSKFHKERYVKQQLVRSLKKQKDPMVQIELIQLLTRMKETSILDELQKMVNDTNTMDAVKDKAYSSILTLGS
jgi:hypothetical protein